MFKYQSIEEKLRWVKDNPPKKSQYKPSAESVIALTNIISTSVRAPNEIPLTPYGKHAWKDTLSRAPFKKERFRVSDDPRKVFAKTTYDALRHGQEFYVHEHGIVTDYSKVTKNHFRCCDFWRNFMRQGPTVTKGAEQRILSSLFTYSLPKKFNPNKISFLEAMEWVYELNATSVSSQPLEKLIDFSLIPFTRSFANVGHPYYRNSRSTVSEIGESADLLAFKLAKSMPLSAMADQPAALVSRDQQAGIAIDPDQYKELGMIKDYKTYEDFLNKVTFKDSKRRPVYAYSRAENYIAAQIFVPIIDKAKLTPMFIGYSDPSKLASFLKKYYEVTDSMKIVAANCDVDRFDTSISAELMIAAGLIVERNISDSYGKQILWETIRSAIYKPIIFRDLNGINRVLKKFGAIPSGWMGTNYFGGIINAIIITYGKVIMYKDFKAIACQLKKALGTDLAVMGDDSLSWFKKYDDITEMGKILLKAFGISVSQVKGEYGVFFLQHRYDGSISYPAPRVWSKLFFVEREKHLFNALWTLASYSKIASLYGIDFNLVKSFVKFDNDKLGLVDYVTKGAGSPELLKLRLKQESAALESDTKTILFDGNPQVEKQFDDKEFIPSMFKRIEHVL